MPKGSKSIYAKEYPVFLELLRETRTRAEFTQTQLAAAAGTSQSYVSAVETGDIRLDTLQLWRWLHVCGTDLGEFGRELEQRLKPFRAQMKRPAKR